MAFLCHTSLMAHGLCHLSNRVTGHPRGQLDNIIVFERHETPEGLYCSYDNVANRSEEHTSELQSLMRISYAVFCLKKKKKQHNKQQRYKHRYSKNTINYK